MTLDQYNLLCHALFINDLIQLIYFTFLLLGNSVYGHSIMDKSKHTSVKFCGLTKASAEINNPRFIHLEEFEDETFEVCMSYH